MGERIGRRRTVRVSWGVSRWEGRGSVVVSQHRGGKEDCGVRLGGSGTCRITGWNERNPCQWTSLALPIFIVPASKACFPSVFPGKDRAGFFDTSFEQRNSSYHLWWYSFSLLFYPTVSHGFALFNLVSLGSVPLLFLPSFQRREGRSRIGEEKLLSRAYPDLSDKSTYIHVSFFFRLYWITERYLFFYFIFCKTVFSSFSILCLAKFFFRSSKFLFVDRWFFFFSFRPKIHEFSTNQRIVKRWGEGKALCCLKDSTEFVRKRVRVSNSAWEWTRRTRYLRTYNYSNARVMKFGNLGCRGLHICPRERSEWRFDSAREKNRLIYRQRRSVSRDGN